ncbi:MAG: hypothetical protein IJ673_09135 [Treponema sp.]|nr:hypothetical protein [Treponema sp.]
MDYEAVLEQVREAPAECLDEISTIISYVVYRHERESEEFNEETKAALDEVERMKKDSSLGKSYTDVEDMFREILS